MWVLLLYFFIALTVLKQVQARPSVVISLYLAIFFIFRSFLWDIFYLGGLTRDFNNGLIDSFQTKALANGSGWLIDVKYDFIQGKPLGLGKNQVVTEVGG